MDDFRKMQVGIITFIIIFISIVAGFNLFNFDQAATVVYYWLKSHLVILIVFILMWVHTKFPKLFLKAFEASYIGILLLLIWNPRIFDDGSLMCKSYYGCCPGSKTGMTDSSGSNCSTFACGTKYGCCSDNETPKSDMDGANCDGYGCHSIYGCCPNGITGMADVSGNNCDDPPPTAKDPSTSVPGHHINVMIMACILPLFVLYMFFTSNPPYLPWIVYVIILLSVYWFGDASKKLMGSFLVFPIFMAVSKLFNNLFLKKIWDKINLFKPEQGEKTGTWKKLLGWVLLLPFYPSIWVPFLWFTLLMFAWTPPKTDGMNTMMMGVVLLFLLGMNPKDGTTKYWLPVFVLLYIIVALSILSPVILNKNVNIILAMTFFGMITLFLNYYVYKQPFDEFITSSAYNTVYYSTFTILLVYALQFIVQLFMVNYVLDVSTFIFFMLVVGGIVGLISVFGVRPEYFSRTNYILKWIVVVGCFALDALNAQTKNETMTRVLILLAEIILIVWYAYRKKIDRALLKGGNGHMVLNDPISLSKMASYPLKHPDVYNIAISFWVYLNPQTPEETPLANTFVNILSYGAGAPKVVYNAALNTMCVTVTKQEDDRILVDEMPHTLLQKWNHFMLIYNKDTFDVFLNGELRTSMAILPELQPPSLILGEDGGANGKICNVMVFYGNTSKSDVPFDPITYDKIMGIYKQFNGKNPPTI